MSHIARKRKQIENLLEAEVALGRVTIEDAQLLYDEAILKLVEKGEQELSNEFLKSKK